MRAGQAYFKGQWVKSLVQDDIVKGDRILTEIYPVNPEKPNEICENTRIRQTRYPGDGSPIKYRVKMYKDETWGDWKSEPHDCKE